MKQEHMRVALAAASAVLLLPLMALGQTLELASEQPSVQGNAASPDDGFAKPKVTLGGTGVYIVQLADPSLAKYEGGIGTMAATSAKANGDRHLDVNSLAARSYRSYLEATQNAMIEHCEKAFGHAIEVPFKYQTVFNGVAMVLTEDEARAISTLPNVKMVEREREEVVTTDDGPLWINAPAIWDTSPYQLPSSMGEGVVVAVLDTGINSDHPSFADIGGDGYDHTNPLGSGNYVPGSYCDTTDPSFCNDKLIGAWTFVQGPSDPMSPEDSDSHGSHTASTAAGNVIPGATILAPTTQLTRDISGVAPHANIIAYDVCIETCPGAALLAAVNQVVIDSASIPGGIAALNYSISGGNDPYNSSVELAFLDAVAAGVYVATSAGNAGPGPETTGHNSPWASATGATTHRRTLPNSVVNLGSDGAGTPDIAGLGLTSGYGPAPIVHAVDFPTANGSQNDTDPAQCLDPFPPGTWNGEIVVCDRGTIARVAKGANVLAGGAGGFVLANVDAQGESIVGDAHFLPGVHIGDSDGDVLRAWLASETGTTATISGFAVSLNDADADIMAGFSSRGPNSSIDILKPDISAPGVSIMAAVSSFVGVPAPEYGFLSGTSMASPHNAGAAALLSAVRPDWTPMEIKSALMMTSERYTLLKEDGSTPADWFDIGAGRIDLSETQHAGLVLDESPFNMFFANPDLGGDPKTLNLASMQDGACVGECSWTRTVRNSNDQTERWRLSTAGPAGLDFETSPRRRVKLGPDETQEITVSVDTRLAEPGWNFASLELDNKNFGPDLHMPIAIFVANSSDPALFNKTVDAEEAFRGEPVNYEINITNGPIGGQIDIVDVLPPELEYVEGSASESVTLGSTISPFQHAGGQLTWSGMLDPGGLQLNASPSPFGFIPLAALGVAPFALPSNCDDGAWIINVPTFSYGGNNYSQVIWSVNGAIEAGTASGLALSASNRDMPDATPPNNLLAPFWTDINLCAGGSWSIAVLNAGPRQFTVYEWTDAPLFGDNSLRYTFQIWVENGAAGQAWFVYGRVDEPFIFATVGIENADGLQGTADYFDGAGTPATVGRDLNAFTQPGGSATLSFQATLHGCRNGEGVVNRANLSADGVEETAIAVTRCYVPEDD